jgi:hypothetical protein
MAAWQFGALSMFGYDVFVADPPWDFENYSDAGTKKGADPHYGVMALKDIKALPLHELARGDYRVCTMHEPILVCTVGNPQFDERATVAAE